MISRRISTIAAAILLLAASGCGDDASPPSDHREHGPRALQPATDRPAEGTHRVVCALGSRHGRVRLALDLPDGFVRSAPSGQDRERGCAWHLPVRVPEDSDVDGDPDTQDTYPDDVVLRVGPAHAGHTLKAEYHEQKSFAVSGDSPEGDDSVLHLKLSEGVHALGPTIGDRLSYLCYCDGQNTIHRMVQADGIVLEWHAQDAIRDRSDRQLHAVLASAGTTR